MEGGNLWKKEVALKFVLLGVALVNTVHGHGTRVGFYSRTCPAAESIVTSTVESYVRSDPTLAAAILRLHFHDCFVRGCDGSVLIAGSGTERTAGPNVNLRGYEVIDDAKEKLEALCPGLVSCADILALAARDSVVLSGGKSWKVATGRKDGRVSIGSETRSLPGRNDNVTVQNKKFKDKGLNTIDLVVLAGTLHSSTSLLLQLPLQSVAFFYNGTTDPSIDPSFVPFLREICPENEPKKRVALDSGSQFKFDTSYLANLKRGRGILRSDQVLWTDPSTSYFVQKYLATDPFNFQFGKSMVKMSNIGVKQGDGGEIRNKCSAIN